MREWNPLWTDPVDAEAPEEYKASIRRAIMASVNYIESRPDFRPRYKDREETIRASLPKETGSVQFICHWELMFKAQDKRTAQWFWEMDNAASRGNPEASLTSFMMKKAMACGVYVMRFGWANFNKFMLEHTDGQAAH